MAPTPASYLATEKAHMTTTTRIATTLALLSGASACALLQRGPIKADPRGASGEQITAAASMRKARENAVQQPASAEAARDYVVAVAAGVQAGLRRDADRWE